MEATSQNQPPAQSLNTEQLPSKVNLWKAGFFALLGLTLIGSILGYYFAIQTGEREVAPTPTTSENQEKETERPTPTKIIETAKQEELLTVNAHTSIDDERGPYFTFQLKYPSKYLVTSDDMVTSYITQGGMAPPRLVFTKNTQPLGKSTYWDVWDGNEDCILVESTSGWNSIEDFQIHGNTAAEPPETVKQEQITILGNLEADRRVVKYKDKQTNNLEVFVQLPETVAYFFQTCNMNSEEDLDILLNNFKVRAFDLEN